MKLELALERDTVAPGEPVKGSVTVVEGGASRSLEVLLAYRESTSDYGATARTVTTGPLHQGDLAAGASFPFELTMPEDALPAWSDGLASLWWEVDAGSDELGPDTHATKRIELTAPARR